MTTLEAAIRREEDLEAAERVAPAADRRPADGGAPRVTGQRDNAEQDPRRGFHTHREFLQAAMNNSRARSLEAVRDERLRPLALVDDQDDSHGEGMTFLLPQAWTPRGLSAAAGSDEQGGYADAYGGILTPRVMLPGVLAVGFEGDPLAGRTQPVPMEAPVVDILARTDKNHATSVSGGLTVTRRPETVAAAGSRMQLEAITLKATSLFGLGYATEEILTDSPASFLAILEAGFRDQFGAHLLNEKLRGVGGAEYLGILNSPALITQAAEGGQTADTINGTNIVKMRSRCWGYGNALWLANHDTLPQLMAAHIAGTNASVFLFAPGNGVDKPDTLLGRPIVFTEFCSTLGDVGDLILVNPTQYLEGLYQPLQSAESVHVRFVNHERTMKFWVRNAGAPWWRSAITPNKSATTLSPMVALAAR
jgi:HK97 family phage major capsid protein